MRGVGILYNTFFKLKNYYFSKLILEDIQNSGAYLSEDQEKIHKLIVIAPDMNTSMTKEYNLTGSNAVILTGDNILDQIINSLSEFYQFFGERKTFWLLFLSFFSLAKLNIILYFTKIR